MHSDHKWSILTPVVVFLPPDAFQGQSRSNHVEWWADVPANITVQCRTMWQTGFATVGAWWYLWWNYLLGRFQRNFRQVIFQLILVIYGWSISCKIVLKWMPMDLTDGKSTLIQVMAWCRQATSHYLSQCWPRSLSPYGIIRHQWVNKLQYCSY